MQRYSQQDWNRSMPQARPSSISIPPPSPSHPRPFPSTNPSYSSNEDNFTPLRDLSFSLHSQKSGEPWSAFSALNPVPLPVAYDQQSHPQQTGLGPPFTPYRPGPKSDASSAVTTANHFSDSGYHTRRTFSSYSGEPFSLGQSCPEIQEPLGNFNPFQALQASTPLTSSTDGARVPNQPAESVSPLQHREKAKILKCEHCSETFRIRSDLKKHINKHDKPHLCTFPGCTRRIGFTSTNDLSRHMKCKHQIHSEEISTYYRCKFATCSKKNNDWSRLDNFRQHLKRVHKKENDPQLVEDCKVTIRVASPRLLATFSPNQQSNCLDSTPLLSDFQSFPTYEPQHSCNSFNPAFTASLSQSIGWTKNSVIPAKSLEHASISNAFANSQSEQDDTAIQQELDDGKAIPPHEISTSADNGRLNYQLDRQMFSGASTSPACTKIKQPESSAISQDQLEPVENDDYAPSQPESSTVNPYQNRMNQNNELAYMVSALAAQLKQQSHVIPEEDLYRAMETLPGLGASRSQEDILMSEEQPVLSCTSRQQSKDPMEGNSPPELNQVNTVDSRGSNCSETELSSRQPRALTERVQCPNCSVTCSRQCDMKKHMLRHAKPFACTFSICPKTFGSKSDWKRHENSQHFQTDIWRCRKPRLSGDSNQSDQEQFSECAKLFQKKAKFRKHLERDHKLQQSELKAETRSSYIGSNRQRQYWCGFCRSIRKLESRGAEAWDERFNHITVHFLRENLHIDKWLMPGNNKFKGQAIEQSKDRPADREYCDSDYSDTEHDAVKYNTDGDGDTDAEIGATPGDLMQFDISKSRESLNMDDADVGIFCCGCEAGPQIRAVSDRCHACSHFFCENCKLVRGNSGNT